MGRWQQQTQYQLEHTFINSHFVNCQWIFRSFYQSYIVESKTDTFLTDIKVRAFKRDRILSCKKCVLTTDHVQGTGDGTEDSVVNITATVPVLM